MTPDRITQLSDTVYDYVCGMLQEELDIEHIDLSEVATAAQRAFTKAIITQEKRHAVARAAVRTAMEQA